jgi:Trk K+ transport system NAD-binding subunit
MASGIPLDLPDGKQLAVGVIKGNTRYVGKTLAEAFPKNGNRNGIEIAAVLRDNQTLLPAPDIELQSGDQLLAVTSPEAWERLNTDFAGLTPRKEQAGPVAREAALRE